jgi:membrane protein implicated in regulation of membrane protease activity
MRAALCIKLFLGPILLIAIAAVTAYVAFHRHLQALELLTWSAGITTLMVLSVGTLIVSRRTVDPSTTP